MARWGCEKDVIIRVMVILGSWAHLGPSWGHLGAILRHLGPILGPSWAIFGPSWGHLGCSKMAISLGRSLKKGPMAMSTRCRYGVFSSRGHLEPCWGNLGRSWGHLGHSWGHLWTILGHFGPSPAHLGLSLASLSHLRSCSGTLWGRCGTYLHHFGHLGGMSSSFEVRYLKRASRSHAKTGLCWALFAA